jgi:hypothetical protein
VGRAVVGGKPVAGGEEKGICPVCAGDFFRIEPPGIVCPICGAVGDLKTYAEERRFVTTGGEPRWGLTWLDSHIESWIEPSLKRYRGRRKQVLSRIKELKARFASGE